MKILGVIILFIAIAFGLYACMNNGHKSQIKEKIESVGGKFIEAELNNGFRSDPFPWYEHGKNIYIYKFKYINKDEVETVGWVKFGLTNRWIMDEKDDAK